MLTRWRGWLTKCCHVRAPRRRESTSHRGPQQGTLADASPQDFQTAFDFGCKAGQHHHRARPVMRARAADAVVNIVTELGTWPRPRGSVYRPAGAMVGMSAPSPATGPTASPSIWSRPAGWRMKR